MTNLMPFTLAWAVLGVIVLVLALMRRNISSHEDDTLHLSGGGAAVTEQVMTAKKLATIDLWGKVLTVVLGVSGLVLGALYAKQAWEAASRAGLG